MVIISSCTHLSTKYAHNLGQIWSLILWCLPFLTSRKSPLPTLSNLGRAADVFHNFLLHLIRNKTNLFKILHPPPKEYQEPATQMSRWMLHDFCCVAPYRHLFERASFATGLPRLSITYCEFHVHLSSSPPWLYTLSLGHFTLVAQLNTFLTTTLK